MQSEEEVPEDVQVEDTEVILTLRQIGNDRVEVTATAANQMFFQEDAEFVSNSYCSRKQTLTSTQKQKQSLMKKLRKMDTKSQVSWHTKHCRKNMKKCSKSRITK